MALYHPRPRFVTLDSIRVVDYFSCTYSVIHFKINLFKSGGDVMDDVAICALAS